MWQRRFSRDLGGDDGAADPGSLGLGGEFHGRCRHAAAGGRGVAAGTAGPDGGGASLGFLALLGAIGGRVGGANVWRATLRVTFWGALAMALTAGIGALVGTVV